MKGTDILGSVSIAKHTNRYESSALSFWFLKKKVRESENQIGEKKEKKKEKIFLRLCVDPDKDKNNYHDVRDCLDNNSQRI